VTFTAQFFSEVAEVAAKLDQAAIEKRVEILAQAREQGGRVFVLGAGGGAANASHAVNDFRKLAAMEAYARTDNIAELTARTNDEAWSIVFEAWLRGSYLGARDVLFVL
jgi:D-sedoheptulose 7-phosphate isomerase